MLLLPMIIPTEYIDGITDIILMMESPMAAPTEYIDIITINVLADIITVGVSVSKNIADRVTNDN